MIRSCYFYLSHLIAGGSLASEQGEAVTGGHSSKGRGAAEEAGEGGEVWEAGGLAGGGIEGLQDQPVVREGQEEVGEVGWDGGRERAFF